MHTLWLCLAEAVIFSPMALWARRLSAGLKSWLTVFLPLVPNYRSTGKGGWIARWTKSQLSGPEWEPGPRKFIKKTCYPLHYGGVIITGFWLKFSSEVMVRRTSKFIKMTIAKPPSVLSWHFHITQNSTHFHSFDDASPNVKLNCSFAEPQTVVLGGPDLYINAGSAINLTCLVRHSPKPTPYIFWYHDDQVSYSLFHAIAVIPNIYLLLSLILLLSFPSPPLTRDSIFLTRDSNLLIYN